MATYVQNLAVDLCLVSDVVDFIGGTMTPEGQNEIQFLITGISQSVATYCGTNFIQRNYVEARNGTGTAMLLPRNDPVTAVASVTAGSYSFPAGTPGGDQGFVFDEDCVYLLGCSVFPRGVQNIVISYTAGYTNISLPNTTIPADLRQAVVEAVADRFKRRQNIGVMAKTIAGETITYMSAAYPKSSRDIFESYRKVACNG